MASVLAHLSAVVCILDGMEGYPFPTICVLLFFSASKVTHSSFCSCHGSLPGEILCLEIVAFTVAKICWCYQQTVDGERQ